jgi:hypothetical protein
VVRVEVRWNAPQRRRDEPGVARQAADDLVVQLGADARLRLGRRDGEERRQVDAVVPPRRDRTGRALDDADLVRERIGAIADAPERARRRVGDPRPHPAASTTTSHPPRAMTSQPSCGPTGCKRA